MIFKSERIGCRDKVSKVGERSQVFTKAYVMGGDVPGNRCGEKCCSQDAREGHRQLSDSEAQGQKRHEEGRHRNMEAPGGLGLSQV